MNDPGDPLRDGGAFRTPIVEEGASAGDDVWERAAEQARRDLARTDEGPSSNVDQKTE
jgi:hypothetical protein